MQIFQRYAPFIREFIYRNSWESLRAIQVAAGDAIFHTDANLLHAFRNLEFRSGTGTATWRSPTRTGCCATPPASSRSRRSPSKR